MKQFGKDCKHARFIREHKWHYQESEIADGCWQCGGELVPSPRKNYTSLDQMGMSPHLRAQLEADPQKVEELLKWMNRPEWVCKACEQKKIARFNAGGNFVPADQVLKNINEYRPALIKEVEECGHDCPYWERLDAWRKDVQTKETDTPELPQ